MKKLVAIICSFFLVFALFSVLNISMFAFAEVETITESSAAYAIGTSSANVAGYSGNLLNNQARIVEYYRNNEATTELDETNQASRIEACFNGLTNDTPNSGMYGGTTSDSNDETQTSDFIQFYIRISGEINNPEKFIFQFHSRNNTAGKNFRSAHYAVFASSDVPSLFDNKIIDITNTNGRNFDIIDLSSLELTGIKYVAVRVYQRSQTSGTTLMQFITELGFFGGTIDNVPSANPVTEHITSSTAPVSLSNQIKATDISVKFVENNTAYGAGECDLKNDRYNRIFDGLTSTAGDVGKYGHNHACLLTDAPNDTIQKETYIELTARLLKPIDDPTDFDIVFHTAAAGKKYCSKHYAIFVSGNSADLFNDENMIIEVTDKSERLYDTADITGNGHKRILYLGVRFYNRGYDVSITSGDNAGESAIGGVQHLRQIALSGGSYSLDLNGDSTVDYNDTEEFMAYLIGIDTQQETVIYDMTDDDVIDIRDLVNFKKQLIIAQSH